MQTQKARFDTRLPIDQKQLFEQAALIGGYRNLTDFIILAAQEKAMAIIKDKETIIASEKDRKIFFDVVFGEIEPNAELISSANEYKKLMAE